MEEMNIGLDAGTIWNQIDMGGIMSIAALKKATKLNERRIYLALGWLAREGKVFFQEKKGELLVALIY